MTDGLYLVGEDTRPPTFVLIDGSLVWPIQMRSPAANFDPREHRLRRVDLGPILAMEPEQTV